MYLDRWHFGPTVPAGKASLSLTAGSVKAARPLVACSCVMQRFFLFASPQVVKSASQSCFPVAQACRDPSIEVRWKKQDCVFRSPGCELPILAQQARSEKSMTLRKCDDVVLSRELHINLHVAVECAALSNSSSTLATIHLAYQSINPSVRSHHYHFAERDTRSQRLKDAPRLAHASALDAVK
jgi:hypothetical protein